MARRLNEEEVLWKLSNLKIGDTIRVRYESFGEQDERAQLESQTSLQRGKDMNVFVGTFENVKENKSGEVYFLIYTADRDHVDATGELRRGNWRAFNVARGRVLGLSKVH